MNYRKEVLSEEFTKHVLDFEEGSTPFHTAIHHFTGHDKGLPHDHPFGFTTHILKGGYVERVYTILDDKTWKTEIFHRKAGTSHYVAANHIHELIELPEGECWTMTVLGPHEQKWKVWKFEKDGIKYSIENNQDFIKYETNKYIK